MKKFIVLCGVVAMFVALSSVVDAIDAGPGGRLYYTQRVQPSGPGTTMYVRLQSFTLGTDWSKGANVNHGDIVDDFDGVTGWSNHVNGGITPEVETPGGSGYGTLVMGLFYNNTPVATAPPRQTMDVLRITPSAGGYAVTLLGDGRANPGGWPVGPCTEDGIMALPNPTFNAVLDTAYTGKAGRVVTSDGVGTTRYHVNEDKNGDGDLTDDANDYVAERAQGFWGEWDFEIYKNRLYGTSAWNSVCTADGIYYIENNGGAYSQQKEWYRMPAYGSGGSIPVGIGFSDRGRIAAGEIKGPTGGPVTVVYGEVGGHYAIGLYADYNADGDALDNELVTGGLREYRAIYDKDSSNVSGDDPGYVLDMELLRNAQGTQFLMFGTAAGSLVVIQLADNGEFAGQGRPNADDYVTVVPNSPFTWGTELFELDSNLNVQAAIPEPATLLLIGTGALGVMGWVRRRRMA